MRRINGGMAASGERCGISGNMRARKGCALSATRLNKSKRRAWRKRYTRLAWAHHRIGVAYISLPQKQHRTLRAALRGITLFHRLAQHRVSRRRAESCRQHHRCLSEIRSSAAPGGK